MRGLGEWTADWFLARHLAARTPGRRATSDCARQWPRSMVTFPMSAAFGVPLPPLREPERPLPPHRPPRPAARMTIRHGTDDDLDAVRRLRERWNAESAAAPGVGRRQLGGEPARGRARARRQRPLPRRGGRRARRLRHGLARGSRRPHRRSLRRRGGPPTRHGAGARRRRDREPARARRDPPLREREPGLACLLRAAGLPRGVPQPRPPPRRPRPSARALVRLDPRPDRRSRRRSSGPCAGSCRACPGSSRGSTVTPPRNGWITVYDDACDREPSMLRSLAGGALRAARGGRASRSGSSTTRSSASSCSRRAGSSTNISRSRSTTEPLPPGDAIALAANPRVVARLTGADPAAVRAAARTAASPDRCRRHASCSRRSPRAIGLKEPSTAGRALPSFRVPHGGAE